MRDLKVKLSCTNYSSLPQQTVQHWGLALSTLLSYVASGVSGNSRSQEYWLPIPVPRKRDEFFQNIQHCYQLEFNSIQHVTLL